MDSRLRGFKRIRPSVVKLPRLEPDFHPCSVAATCYGHAALRTLSESDRCRDHFSPFSQGEQKRLRKQHAGCSPFKKAGRAHEVGVSRDSKEDKLVGAKKPAPGVGLTSLTTISFEFGPKEQGGGLPVFGELLLVWTQVEGDPQARN